MDGLCFVLLFFWIHLIDRRWLLLLRVRGLEQFFLDFVLLSQLLDLLAHINDWFDGGEVLDRLEVFLVDSFALTDPDAVVQGFVMPVLKGLGVWPMFGGHFLVFIVNTGLYRDNPADDLVVLLWDVPDSLYNKARNELKIWGGILTFLIVKPCLLLICLDQLPVCIDLILHVHHAQRRLGRADRLQMLDIVPRQGDTGKGNLQTYLWWHSTPVLPPMFGNDFISCAFYICTSDLLGYYIFYF